MADRREDSTRELVSSAEALLTKGKGKDGHDSTMERLVAEADAVMGKGGKAGKGGSIASTRELVARSEDMLGSKGRRGTKAAQGRMSDGSRSGMLFVIIAAVAILAAVGAYLALGKG